MPVEFEFTPDRAYLRAVSAHTSRFSRAYAAGYVLVLAVAAAAGVAAGGWGVVAAGLCLIVAVVLGCQRTLGFGRSFARLPDSVLVPRRYTVTAEEVTMTRPGMSARYAWWSFARAERTPDAFLLHTGLSYVDIPVRTMTPEQVETVEALVAGLGRSPAVAP